MISLEEHGTAVGSFAARSKVQLAIVKCVRGAHLRLHTAMSTGAQAPQSFRAKARKAAKLTRLQAELKKVRVGGKPPRMSAEEKHLVRHTAHTHFGPTEPIAAFPPRNCHRIASKSPPCRHRTQCLCLQCSMSSSTCLGNLPRNRLSNVVSGCRERSSGWTRAQNVL